MHSQPMPKICYILKRFPRLTQTFVLHELLELERQGAELTIVALRGAGEPLAQPQLAGLRAPVHYLSADTATPAGDKQRALGEQAAQIVPLVRALGITHIHAHFATWAAAAAAHVSAQTGIPFSFTAHAHDIFHTSVDPQRLAQRVSQARFVVTVSDYNRAYLDRLLAEHGCAGEVVRLYNGIDLAQFVPAGAPREADLIVGVGRLVEKKGFADLVEACRLLLLRGRPVRCVIVGAGEQRAALEQQIAQAGLREYVALLGAQPQAAVMRLIGRAAALALPCVVGSDGDRDGLPTVLVEAMALGTPVVSTSIVGIPELIEHGRSGLLVPPHDPPALAAALGQLRDSATLRARLSATALERVRADFSLAANVGRLYELFIGA